MKVRFNKTTFKGLGAIAASFVLVVSFQNCGKAGFDSELDSNLPSGLSDAEIAAKYGSTVGAKVTAIPFAIDTRIDTVSYNSCSGSHLSGVNGFFSLKVGAFTSAGGVQLNSNFKTYADSNFNPIYPATQLSTAQYKEFLADSPANGGATPTMAIRMKSNLLGVYTQSSGSTVNLTTDVVPLVGNLTDTLVMDAYVGKSGGTNYFPFSAEKKIVDATFSFNKSEKLQDDYRNILMGEGVLSLTYLKEDGENYEVRSPSSAASRAYGRGYYLQFSQFPSGVATNPNVLLRDIAEVDLSSGTTSGGWSCRQIPVVSTTDLANGKVVCPTHTFAELQTESIRAQLEIYRRHFPADQWEINVGTSTVNPCAYPKGSVSCYKEEVVGTSRVVEYNPAVGCFRENGTVTSNSRCMHYLSVCTRSN